MQSNAGDRVFGRVSVAIVTPFVDPVVDLNQPVDNLALEGMINHVASGLASAAQCYQKVGGIIVSGTTGEQHTMTIEERFDLYRRSVATAGAHGVPIIAGIAGTTISAIAKLTNAALNAGCKGIMLGLPPYCRLCDEEIKAYVLSVRMLVPEGFPILLYNNAMRNGYGPSLPLLAELCRTNVLWGIKHAVLPDDFMRQAKELMILEPSCRLYTGSDKMSGDLLNLAGEPSVPFYGVTSIVGNLYPRKVAIMVSKLTKSPLVVGASEADGNGNDMHAQLVPLLDAVLLGTSLPTGLKYALRSTGLPAGYPRAPVGHISVEKQQEITAALQAYNSSI